MLKRISIRDIKSCKDCDFLDTIDGFATHSYICPVIGKVTGEADTTETIEQAESEMREWFEKSCPLPTAKKEYNLKFESHQLQILIKIKDNLVKWQNYEAAHHIREAIKLLEQKLEGPKDESATTVIYKLDKQDQDISI